MKGKDVDSWDYYKSCSGGNGGSGGGLYNRNGLVHILNCNFFDNYSGTGGFGHSFAGNSSGGDAGNGGALYAVEGDVLIDSTVFHFNLTGNGGKGNSNNGGISGSGGNGGSYGWVCSQGGIGGSGGGISMSSSKGSLKIINSLISGNKAGLGYLESGINYYFVIPHSGNGGGISTDTSRITLINVTCADNRTGISRLDNQPISINDSLFDDVLGLGGGIYAPDTGLFILNSIISDNTIADTLIDNDIAGVAYVDFSLVRDSSRCEISGGNNIFNTAPVFNDFPVV